MNPLFLGPEMCTQPTGRGGARVGAGVSDLLGPRGRVVCRCQADLESLKSRQARLSKGGPGLKPKVFLANEGSDKEGEFKLDIWKLFSFCGRLRGSGIFSLGHSASTSQRPGVL